MKCHLQVKKIIKELKITDRKLLVFSVAIKGNIKMVDAWTYYHGLFQLYPEPFQSQHITTAVWSHGSQPKNFHQGKHSCDHSAMQYRKNHEEELGTPLASLDPHQDDSELQDRRRIKVRGVELINNLVLKTAHMNIWNPGEERIPLIDQITSPFIRPNKITCKRKHAPFQPKILIEVLFEFFINNMAKYLVQNH